MSERIKLIMTINHVLTFILVVCTLLTIGMFYTGILSCTNKLFDNKKPLIIVKDTSELIIIPLLINLFTDDKLTNNQFNGMIILLSVLFVIYLAADIQLNDPASSKLAKYSSFIKYFIKISIWPISILIITWLFMHLLAKTDTVIVWLCL